jgi:hypothetical protein
MTYDSAVHPMPCPKEDPGRPFGGNTLIPLKNGSRGTPTTPILCGYYSSVRLLVQSNVENHQFHQTACIHEYPQRRPQEMVGVRGVGHAWASSQGYTF